MLLYYWGDLNQIVPVGISDKAMASESFDPVLCRSDITRASESCDPALGKVIGGALVDLSSMT